MSPMRPPVSPLGPRIDSPVEVKDQDVILVHCPVSHMCMTVLLTGAWFLS